MIETSVFVELDCLFDTRIATIASLDEDLAKEVLESDWYFSRVNDFFWDYDERVKEDEFLERWKARDLDILFSSFQTAIPNGLRLQVAELISQFSKGQDEHPTKLTVNTYPYPRDKVEAILHEALSRITMFDEIDFVSYGMELCKPTILKYYGTVIIYDMDAWLNHHHEELSTNTMYRSRFVCPLILKKVPDKASDIPKIVNETRTTLAGVLNYSPQGLDDFSVHIEE